MKLLQSSRARLLQAAPSLAIVVAFGFAPASVLAGKTHEEVTGALYDNTKAPHESPHKAEPPTGGHKNLAEAATNPLANLMQFQFQYPSTSRRVGT